MAYQIEYDSDQVVMIKKEPAKELCNVIILVMLLVGGTILAHLGGAIFQKIVLDNQQETYAAAEQLVWDLQSGIPVQDAVQTFYAELMQ